MWLEVGGVISSMVPMADNSPNTQICGKFTVYESQLVSSFTGRKAKRRGMVCIVNARYVKEAELKSCIFKIFFY